MFVRSGRFLRTAILLFFLLIVPLSPVFAEPQKGPPYPNLESFTIESSPAELYMAYEYGGGLTPNYHFPALKNLNAFTMTQYHPLKMTGGKFILSGTTGPEGNVTGSFSYTGFAEQIWETGELDTYAIKAEGKITNAKAAFDDKGFLRVMGAAHYERKHEMSGTATLTMGYSARGYDEDNQETQFSGQVSAQANIAFISCISDLEEINLCYFETGNGYGDYGFSANFVTAASENFVWFNNLDYEFGLISGIDFDPEAHHKLTQEPGDDSQAEEEIVLDESYLDKPEKAVELEDDPEAGFFVNLGCNNEIYPRDGISCDMAVTGGDENQTYTVNWIMDGYVIKSGTVLMGSDNFIFPNPPPGQHAISVQVMDDTSYNVRVASTGVEVLVPEDFGKIKPWTQAAAGMGSVGILGAWLWAEWAAAKAKEDWFKGWTEKQEAALQQDRDAWFEKQMAKNDAVRARQKIGEEYQQEVGGEWKRFRGALLETVKKFEKSEYLVDLYDDMHSDVYRNGKWDGKALMRLEELVNTHLKMDRQHEAHSEWKRQMKFLNKRQEAFSDLMGSWTAMGVEVAAGIMTGGASEMVFMPTRAIGNALYASKRAKLLGKTGWNAAKSVMIESGTRLGLDYIFAKGGEKVIGKLFDYGGAGAKRVIGEEGMEAVADWWQRTATKFGKAPSPDLDLPVIKQNWGKGPQVFVNKPIFKPGKIPPVDLGMENYLNNRIRPLSSELAEDMGRLFREGVEVNPKLNNLLKAGERYTLSASDEVAVKIMNNPAYKQAVREGLVPSSAQQIVYQARDKICKNAIQDAFKRLDDIVIDGNSASSYVKSVAITGTGAKPLSPQAIGRYTDFDATVIAGDSKAARQAERAFNWAFNESLETAGVKAGTAEVNMFSGLHAEDAVPVPGGYTSEPMIHWQKVDMLNRGRSAVRTNSGGLMFDAHPDVTPVKAFGPMEAIPHFPSAPATAAADARQVILNHVSEGIAETGSGISQGAILRQEGKHAMRVWKTINVGKGLEPPAWINKLEALKRNPEIPLSARETSNLWKNYTEFLNLPNDLGAG